MGLRFGLHKANEHRLFCGLGYQMMTFVSCRRTGNMPQSCQIYRSEKDNAWLIPIQIKISNPLPRKERAGGQMPSGTQKIGVQEFALRP